jgi:3-hydroxyacyl-[acyl-carrier-protein] dehydratase
MSGKHDRITQAEWRVTIDPESPYFAGHFPGLPIYPGVAVLQDVILRRLATVRPELRCLRAITRAKFRRAIVPGQELDVHVTFLDEVGHVDVRIFSQSQLCVTARLCFDGR